MLRFTSCTYGRPFARVLHPFLVKEIDRWLPWMLPGSTGRLCKDDLGPYPFCTLIKYIRAWRGMKLLLVCIAVRKTRGTYIHHSNTFKAYGRSLQQHHATRHTQHDSRKKDQDEVQQRKLKNEKTTKHARTRRWAPTRVAENCRTPHPV